MQSSSSANYQSSQYTPVIFHVHLEALRTLAVHFRSHSLLESVVVVVVGLEVIRHCRMVPQAEAGEGMKGLSHRKQSRASLLALAYYLSGGPSSEAASR